MFQKNPSNFGNGDRVLIGPMTAWNDEFALISIEVAAPVGNDAIGADGFGRIKITTLATITND